MISGDPILLSRSGWSGVNLSSDPIRFDLANSSELKSISNITQGRDLSNVPFRWLVPVCIEDICGGTVEIENHNGTFSLLSVGRPILTSRIAADRKAFHLQNELLTVVESFDERMRFVVSTRPNGKEQWLPLGSEARKRMQARSPGGHKPFYSWQELMESFGGSRGSGTGASNSAKAGAGIPIPMVNSGVKSGGAFARHPRHSASDSFSGASGNQRTLRPQETSKPTHGIELLLIGIVGALLFLIGWRSWLRKRRD